MTQDGSFHNVIRCHQVSAKPIFTQFFFFKNRTVVEDQLNAMGKIYFIKIFFAYLSLQEMSKTAQAH